MRVGDTVLGLMGKAQMRVDGVGNMHGEITEPLDWFAADATQDDITVPDWGTGSPYLMNDWDGGALTQPALSFDSAFLAGLPLPSITRTGDGISRAMRIYLLTTLLLGSVLFGMFFVFGGTFQAPVPRFHHTTTIIAAASLSGQSTIVQTLAPLPPSPQHKLSPQKLPSKPPTPPATGDDGGSLWPDVPPTTIVSPSDVTPPDAPPSLWSTP